MIEISFPTARVEPGRVVAITKHVERTFRWGAHASFLDLRASHSTTSAPMIVSTPEVFIGVQGVDLRVKRRAARHRREQCWQLVISAAMQERPILAGTEIRVRVYNGNDHAIVIGASIELAEAPAIEVIR